MALSRMYWDDRDKFRDAAPRKLNADGLYEIQLSDMEGSEHDAEMMALDLRGKLSSLKNQRGWAITFLPQEEWTNLMGREFISYDDRTEYELRSRLHDLENKFIQLGRSLRSAGDQVPYY